MVNIVFPRDRQERWVPPNTHTGKIIAYEKKAHLQKAELKLKNIYVVSLEEKNLSQNIVLVKKLNSYNTASAMIDAQLLRHPQILGPGC